MIPSIAVSHRNAILQRLSSDRVIRFVLFPLSAVFAVASLALAVRTYTDLQGASISHAFVTVQSVAEAYRIRTEYPGSVVLSSADRHFEHFWVVSGEGDVLASNEGAEPDMSTRDAIREAILESDGESFLQRLDVGGAYMLAGTRSADSWTIVRLSAPFVFSTAIWLILSILALSLMSMTGRIAVRHLTTVRDPAPGPTASPAEVTAAQSDPDETTPGANAGRTSGTAEDQGEERADLSRWRVGSGGETNFLRLPIGEPYVDLQAAVLKATDDFVIVLDGAGRLVYSNPGIQLTDVDKLAGVDPLAAFAERHLDDRARSRFEIWLQDGPGTRSLTMDVRDAEGTGHPTRWTAHSFEMHSGSVFDVYVGHRILIEEFPEPTR
jgi:PAS domain-containing protein